MKYYTARVRGPDPCQISIRRYATNYLRPTHCYENFYRNDKSLLAKLEEFFRVSDEPNIFLAWILFSVRFLSDIYFVEVCSLKTFRREYV